MTITPHCLPVQWSRRPENEHKSVTRTSAPEEGTPDFLANESQALSPVQAPSPLERTRGQLQAGAVIRPRLLHANLFPLCEQWPQWPGHSTFGWPPSITNQSPRTEPQDGLLPAAPSSTLGPGPGWGRKERNGHRPGDPSGSPASENEAASAFSQKQLVVPVAPGSVRAEGIPASHLKAAGGGGGKMATE